MEESAGDRRARRSRKLLKQGLLELLREKGFSRISVRDITERMDLNRSTFYLHYADTTDLMRSLEKEILSEIQQLVDAHMQETVEGNSLRPVFEPLLDYVVANRETCAALFEAGSGSEFLPGLRGVVYQNGLQLIRARYHPINEEQLAYLFNFAAFGLIGLLKAWFDREMELPKEDLIRQADVMVTGAVSALLGSGEP